MSSFGWTYFSKDALRRAEAQLSDPAQGVRDEVGFLTIHQRYADRFFPGTSVLHTRLRYILFVPWLYQSLYASTLRGPAERVVERKEIDLADRLRLAAGGGAIGADTSPEPVSQPPTVVYWSALATWGFLKPRANGRMPSRSQIHALLGSRTRPTLDDDGQPLVTDGLPFSPLPPRPANWEGDGPLDFRLGPKEKTFLFDRLTELTSPIDRRQKCLLATVAARGPIRTDNCWDPLIAEISGDERAFLARAGAAASLAAIGRAVYAALVETAREEQDGLDTPTNHRDQLGQVLDDHAAIAGRIDRAMLFEDIRMQGRVPDSLIHVVGETLDWIRSGVRNPASLRPVYERAERQRKGSRARLPDTLGGQTRRLEWDSDQHAPASPLHYRWKNVMRLLDDLWAA